MTDIDWSDDDVAKFIAEEINDYGFEVSPEQSKQGISRWKLWLWLEKHGYDFAYQSLEREIVNFRIKEPRSILSLESERRLLLAVRGVMRDILSLPPLDAEAKASLLATVPISNWTHWSQVFLPGSAGSADENGDYSHIVDFIWDYLRRDRPDYIRILREIKALDEKKPEEFMDNYTINGAYDLSLTPVQRNMLYYIVTAQHRTRAYDMYTSLGNRKAFWLVGTRFVDSIDIKLG
jgi:hypothetical protein